MDLYFMFQSLFLLDKPNRRILSGLASLRDQQRYRHSRQVDTDYTNKRTSLLLPAKVQHKDINHYSFFAKTDKRISLFLPGKPKPDRRIFCVDFPHRRGMKAAHLGNKGL